MERDESFEIIATRLIQIQEGLNEGSIKPNIDYKQDHVVKIITGKGNHSSGAPVLRFQIPTVVKKLGFKEVHNHP